MRRECDAREMSGEVECSFEGSLVGVFSFSGPNADSSNCIAISCPLASEIGECHVGS